jgi:hypothetical protein
MCINFDKHWFILFQNKKIIPDKLQFLTDKHIKVFSISLWSIDSSNGEKLTFPNLGRFLAFTSSSIADNRKARCFDQLHFG